MLTKEQKKQARAFKKEEREIKRAKEIAHCRGFKNFWWWFFGFMSSFIITGTVAAVCVCVIPMSTYVGKDGKYVDEDTSNQTLLQFLMNYKNYSVSNFPIIKEALQKLVTSAGLDKYVTVDYDKLADALTFDVSKISFEYLYKNCIDIICTVDTLNLGSLLGDFANLSIMNENTLVEGEIDTTSESFKAYMYYYLDDDGTLRRAFDDDKKMVEEAIGKPLYYPALRKIPVDELINVLPNRIGQEKVLNVIRMVTTVEKDSIFEKLFDGYTIEGMGSFDVNTVHLCDLITITDTNRSMFNIICSAIKLEDGQEKPTPETLTVGDLSSLDINNAHLVDIVEPSTKNEDLYRILVDATGKKEEDILISDVMKAKIDNVKLSTLLPYEGNEKLADFLVSATGKEYESISMEELKGINTDYIKLKDVITGFDESLKNILVKGYGADSFDDLTIGTLNSTFDMNLVKISDAMPNLSGDIKDILVSGCSGDSNKSYQDLTFKDLNNFTIDNVPLSLVIKKDSEGTNDKLIEILTEACTTKNSFDDMVVGDLSNGFNIDNVRLLTVLGENDNLFDILQDATGKNKEEIKISDLSDPDFSLDNVRLSTVIKEDTGNKILDVLRKDDDVTLSNIGTKINDMYIYDFYGDQCFTLDSSNAAFPDDHYVKGTDSNGLVTFTLDTDGDYTGDYYVSKNTGFLGLLCFTVTDYDLTNGKPNKYVQSDYKYIDLESNSNTNNVIENATIYQLIAAGAIANKEDGGYTNSVLRMTIKQILDVVAALPSY